MNQKTFINIGLLILIIVIAGALQDAKSTPTPSSPSEPTGATLSKLKVSGNRIVTEEGQDIRLRGVNFEDPLLLDKSDNNGDGLPDNHFAEIATDFARVKALGANIVRLPLYPGYYRLVGGELYLSTYVDRMVDLAEQNGLYVSISYHAIGRPGGWYDVGGDNALSQYPARVHYSDSDMAVAFWNKVAARYGQRKHVLFEMYNEPADGTAPFTWSDWRPTGELLIATIRQHSTNIILGPGIDYTGDLSAVPTNPYTDSNLVYVAHIYPGSIPREDNNPAGWERLFGFLARTYPVIVSEWGFYNGSTEPVVNGTLEGFGKPLLDYFDQKNLPWIAYGYFVPDGEPPMLKSDWTTLNEFGKFVKERLQGATPTPTPTPTPTSTPTPTPTPTPTVVQVSGRVLTPDGRGVRNAMVSIADSQGVKRIVTTSSFGYYSFDNVTAGGTYVVDVTSRRYRFAPRVLQVTGTLTDVDFVGQE